MTQALILADSARGVYIPQHFAESIRWEYVRGVSGHDQHTLLRGPTLENEWYWETWDRVLDNARLIDADGVEYVLYQDCDLFAVPVDEIETWMEGMA